MQLDKSRLCRAKTRHRVVTKIRTAQKTTFLQITIWVIRFASARPRSRTWVGMMGTLAGELVGTAGAIGCLLQPLKGPVASSSEQRTSGWVWRRDPSRSSWTALGALGTFIPRKQPSQDKAAPRIRLMEQTSLNHPTPSAGSSTSASASAVPFFYACTRAPIL